jgi:hypothetical protein
MWHYKRQFAFVLLSLTLCGIAQAQVTVKVVADNSYALFVGDQGQQATFVGTGTVTLASQFANAGNYAGVTLGSCGYVYIVAWSDQTSAQGLLASVSGSASTVNTGALGTWQVFATGTNLGTSGIPSSAPFASAVNAQITNANTNNLWVAPAIGVSNITGNGIWPNVPAIPTTAKWTWYQSGNTPCAGTQSPFKPGCNHKEYLIFRLPVKGIVPPPAFTSLNPDFTLQATLNAGNATTFQVLATMPALPVGASFWWQVEEIDCAGNTVAGTVLTNPAAWWTLPTANNFPGYTFQAGHRYKIRRGVWSSCVPWTEKAKTVEMGN